MKGILSRKDAIEAAIRAGIPSKRKKLKPAKHSELDEGVLISVPFKRKKSANLRNCVRRIRS